MKSIQFSQITLIPLSEKDIEQVRLWRNSKKIADYMFFRDHISVEDQKQWFKSLSPDTDFYFIIQYDKKNVGLAHLSNVDIENKIGEVGLFIYDEKLWGTSIPVMASIALLQFSFTHKNLEQVTAKVLSKNKRAQAYNESLGFSTIKNEKQVLEKSVFKERYEKWKEIFKKTT